MPVDKIFELNLLRVKYFDADHSEPYLHAYMSQLNPVIKPRSENKYLAHLWIMLQNN